MYNSASNTKFIVEHEARHVIVQCGVKSWFCLYYSGIQSTVVDRGVQGGVAHEVETESEAERRRLTRVCVRHH